MLYSIGIRGSDLQIKKCEGKISNFLNGLLSSDRPIVLQITYYKYSPVILIRLQVNSGL